MRLTRYTDYAFRVLIHLALDDEGLCSIGQIARSYSISHNHLIKVVGALARHGAVETIRGRTGGIRLGRPAETITVGEVVRWTEEGFTLADCSGCLLSPACGLTGMMAEGAAAMLEVFDSYTIADLLTDKVTLRRMIAGGSPLGVGCA
jgi:Rrf2 family nitric oxide-sensitive transcriptional repressor